jgi:nicotinate-nucleotide pyrophosphorylase (carboxylating)
MPWNTSAALHLIRDALQEDAARRDITTLSLIPANLTIEAVIRSKAPGVICGVHWVAACFRELDHRCRCVLDVRDGQSVKAGRRLLTLRGQARGILSAERTALNGLQHLSGIATATRDQVRHLHSKHTAIFDTRKTLPGWRVLQKYAVQCGGGKNHRMDLKSSVLIKENHLQICRLINHDWIKSINALRKRHPALQVELEIQSPRDLQDALRLKPDQILLDNMTPRRLSSLVKFVRSNLPAAEIEISGGVRTEQLPALSRLGAERISMGRITHSVPALDCSLDIIRVLHPR